MDSENKEIVLSYFRHWAQMFGIMDSYGITESAFIKMEEERQPTSWIGSQTLGGDYNFNDGDW